MTNEELLDRLCTSQEGTCWWCGDVADSREHKHKKTLVKRMWGEEGLVVARPGERPYTLRGPDSPAVKFKRVLCRQCNNARSQPFDRAYDSYLDYLDRNVSKLSRARFLDWREVYGPDWAEPARALGCYAVKNFGCWMAQSGVKPPLAFASFLDGDDLLDTRVMVVRQQRDSLVNRALRLTGDDGLHNGFGVRPEYGWADAEGTRLIAYEGRAYVRDVAIQFNWADGTGKGDLFWRSAVTRMEVLPASVAERAFAVQLRWRLLGERVRNWKSGE